jgi:hypothetical protein
MGRLHFDDKGRFVVEDYNRSRTFASFLPGIAGLNGIPMWVFYVNRGQAIASFGIENKDGCIMEFLPADKSYQATPYKGFRTFIKWAENGRIELVEPFSGARGARETMYIKPDELELNCSIDEKGVDVRVSYFTMPGESFAALVRKVVIRNTSPTGRVFEILDGMPAIIPHGIDYATYKTLGYTLKSWMEVFNLENCIPFCKVRVSIADSAEVTEITGGHFYMSFLAGSGGRIIKPIVDVDLIFGENTSLSYPDRFMECGAIELSQKRQVSVNKVPCSFTAVERELAPGGEVTIYSMIGHVDDIRRINDNAATYADAAFIERKREESAALIQSLTDMVKCKTSSGIFDAYARQCWLDNVLRGGYPLILGGEKDPKVYHVFSRKHGDLERDYNFFSLSPEFYSQGNGNYRDTNQNRRNDCWFFPATGDFNIRMFMSLIQLDGYNPLVVKGCTFRIRDEGISVVARFFDESVREDVSEFFKKSYTPGQLVKFIRDNGITSEHETGLILNEALSYSAQNIEADFGEGYWSDHWTYNMDLIESYLAIFPEKKHSLLFDRKNYFYYDSYAFVAPRKEKHVLAGGRVRQYNAVVEDEQKKAFIEKRGELHSWVRTEDGTGSIYRTTLYEKLLCLALVKFATLDPLGMGIEMEAGKPGWDDSLNGLPGLFGSGMPESFELKRLIRFLLEVGEPGETVVELPEEICDLLFKAEALVESYYNDPSENRDFTFWDNLCSVREDYREKVRYGLSGRMAAIEIGKVGEALRSFLKKLDSGIEKALAFGGGLPPTYFAYEALDYKPLDDGKNCPDSAGRDENVRVLSFKPRMVNYFLEGAVKYLRVLDDRNTAKALFGKIRNSGIYDRKLKMYKICASMADEPFETGRVKAFTPGWLENESIFTHMEYKYILELLKAGLYDEFFEDMENVLIPFMDPEVYGRSTIENSSFIASSANPDESVHGRGFVARLSGSTAEFLSMWIIMMVGKAPFSAADGTLCLELSPILPGRMFDEGNEVSFRFLGSCDVTYVNPSRKDTFGENRARIERMEITMKDGEVLSIRGSRISSPYAERIRNGEGKSIKCYMV